LVALEVATRRPDSFTGIIAMSPSLWWNDSKLVGTYYDALAKVSQRERVFVTSGGLEGDIDRPTVRLSQRMDSLKPTVIAFGHNRYPDDTHGLTPAPSLVDGLRFIFEPIAVARLPISALGPSSDSSDFVRAVIESKRLYAEGARMFGMDTRLPETQLNNVGYSALQALRNPGLALWAFRQNVELYPNSANVYDSLGDGLLAAGDTTAAKAEYRRGIEVGTRNHDPVIGETVLKLNALESKPAKAKAP
jgi:hypothetical protein